MTLFGVVSWINLPKGFFFFWNWLSIGHNQINPSIVRLVPTKGKAGEKGGGKLVLKLKINLFFSWSCLPLFI